MISKKKAESIRFIIINEVSYFNDAAKKFEINIPENSTLFELRKLLGKELSLTWEEVRIVAKFELS